MLFSTRTIEKPHLSTKSGIFDADAPSGVRTDLVLYGKSVESIIVNGKKLTGGLDYSTSGSQIMLNESWLKTLTNGNYTLTYTFSDGNTDTFALTVKNVKSSHTHSYTAKVTKEATCTTDGKRIYTCTCGDKYTETIPATGHSESAWIIDKAATATENGSKHTECTTCGKVIKTEVIPATGEVSDKKETVIFTGSAKTSGWGQAITLSTTKEGGSFDSSVIEKDGYWHIAVYNTTAEQIADLEAAEGVLSTQMISIDENDVFRITLKNPDEVYEFASRYLSETTEYSYHTELLSYLGISQSESIKSLIMGIAAALLLIIAVGAISLIYNAFAISVSERTKELGLLSSIGATQKDIRTIVYSEALLLGTVAIPIGIVLGLLTSWALLDIFGAYMGKVLYVNIGMRLHINGWLLMITAIFGYLLVLLSAGVPARAASKISIIGNLKGEKGVMKVKCSNFTSSAENLLAKRTIKREKKAFRAITFSLAISIFLFVSANAFSLYMLSFVEAERKNIGYDLRMNYSMEFGTKEFDELYSFVKSQDGIDEVGWFAESPSHFHSVLLDSEWITDSYRGSDWATLKESSELYKAPFYIFIISNERYSEFLSQNGLKNDNSVYASAFYDEIDEDSKSTSFPILKDGSYHADVRYMSEAASERLSQDINANPNDRFDYENYYDTFFSVNFTVGNYDFPLEFRPNYGGISILIPESRMPEFNAEITSKEIMIQSPNYANIQKNTTDYLTSVGLAEDVSIFSSAESYESQRNFAAMIKLFSTSFLILLTVISCANVFNVITTRLNMRKREFAVLRSVGMTVNKLFAMLCIENLRNGLLAILIGGISSLPLCYLIYKSIVVGAVIDFVFPLGAFVISSLAMFLIMFLTSLYGLWKIKNGDIIADVRNDFV